MIIRILLGILVAVLSGCATSHNVTVGQLGEHKKITTAALVSGDGNSADMDSEIKQQLLAYGVTSTPNLPAGTRQTSNVDVIVSYDDVWRWDLVMYLQSLTVNLFDGQTGNLLATGNWKNSLAHGFHNSRDVIKELLDDMFAKLPVENPKNKVSQQNDSRPSTNSIETSQTTISVVSASTVSGISKNTLVSH